MKMPWLAAMLNFFFMGLGTLYLGRRKAFGAGLTIAAGLLTWVELSLRPLNPTLWAAMFAAVFLANTCFALDALSEARTVNGTARG